MTKTEALIKIKELEEYINELDKPKGISSGRARPDKKFYSIGVTGAVRSEIERGQYFESKLYEAGNYYQTKEQAIAHEKKIRVYRKLLKYADELNEGSTPCWSDDYECQYTITYAKETDYLSATFIDTNTDLLPLFKTRKLALKAWGMLTEEEQEIFKS